MKKYIPGFILFLIILNFVLPAWFNKDFFLQSYDTNYWKVRYEESQWAQGLESKTPMGDAELYAYAAWRQINGQDPTEINGETPPLGKYFIGLSILIFRNQNLPSLLFGALLLLITFLISKKFLHDLSWALVPVLLLAIDKLFLENILTSLLDLPFAFFSTLALLFLIKARENHKFYFLLTLTLAAVATTKTYLVGFGLVAVIFIYLFFLFLFFRYKDIFWFIIALPFFALFYVATYTAYFLNGHNFWDFKYYHFWVRHFARVQVENYPRFEILRILLLGKWKTWWDDSGVVSVNSWNPSWPIGTFISLISTFIGLLKKDLNLITLGIWIFSFLGMYAYGVPYPRYLLPVLPPLYIVMVYAFKLLLFDKICLKIKH